ncbi:unnamed protein product [Meloidogyne enterolobii]|uniref:Uncharacterized protein n=1 Tax=Meloidogyne enterolobii TaxID=390850 RepID=A0ACB1AA24_MELEN
MRYIELILPSRVHKFSKKPRICLLRISNKQNSDSEGGCGTCDEKKIEKSCVDCKDLKCNSKELLAKTIFCYEKVKNGNVKEGKRPCLAKKCFISYDTKIGNFK